MLTNIADNTQLATSERLKAKLEKILATRSTVAAGDRKEESDRRVREAETRASEAESRAMRAQREMKA